MNWPITIIKFWQDNKTIKIYHFIKIYQFQTVYKVSWNVNYGTKYKKSAIVSIGIKQNQCLPSLGKICEIFINHKCLYFEVSLFETVRFNYLFQSSEVKELVNEPTKIVR